MWKDTLRNTITMKLIHAVHEFEFKMHNLGTYLIFLKLNSAFSPNSKVSSIFKYQFDSIHYTVVKLTFVFPEFSGD